uniref:Dynein axonemal assembly factor 5 TPR repeats domain-containing protein n=1 Tax=Hirondellea gigas TaxID=1518452 RepID=A0A6A7G1B8_9CRUS
MSDTTNEAVQNLVDGLCSQQKLLRDRGLVQLKTAIAGLSDAALTSLITNLMLIVEKRDSAWESKHGSLEGLRVIVTTLQQQREDSEDWDRLRSASLALLTDAEVRVRQAAGCLLGVMCSVDRGATYSICHDTVLQLVRNNLERQLFEPDGAENDGGGVGAYDVSTASIDQLKHKLANSTARERRMSGSRDPAQIFHDTAGWKNLESSLNCLQEMIQGTGDLFTPYCDEELVVLIMATLTHANRFVRETGFGVCAALVSNGFVNELSDGPVATHGATLVQHLGLGLADNWSQVRLAASVATRKFLTSLPPCAQHSCYPALLPRICLNRYYVAEGVRLYSQETWRQVAGTEGKSLVQQYMQHVVEYYIEATAADNHAVREAACACIAELATKLPGGSVQPYVEKLLEALLSCFTDDSWPVRDAACVACGNFIQSFPEEGRPSMERLYPLFFANLQDSIPSVRQGAAVALGNVVQAYGSDAIQRIAPMLRDRLNGVSSQSNESERNSEMESVPANYGVAKRQRDNDIQLHEDRQMYSCGSLAPKMGRGSGGGCSDCKFRRPPQPWEGGDGAVWLVGELAMVGGHDGHNAVMSVLAEVAESCKGRHYTQHVTLLESLCKNLPRICKGIGKNNFKPHLHHFIDLIFYALECENSLTSSAASQCLTALSTDIGPNILRGRIEEHNTRYLTALDANNYSAPF